MELRIEEALQQEATRNRAIYMRGKAMFLGECVELMQCLYDGRLKNPYVIEALVQGTQQYDVNLAFSKNGNCRKKHCSCLAFRTYSGACKHVIATLLAAQAAQAAQQLEFTVMAMPDGPQAEASEQATSSQSEAHLVTLTPVFLFESGMYYLELRIARQRGYIVKSIPQFLQALEQHKHVAYGKELAFIHAYENFTLASQRLITMVSLLDKQFKRKAYTFRDKYDERRMRIGANIVTMLIERQSDVHLQFDGHVRSYTRVSTLPTFQLESQVTSDAITLRFAPTSGLCGAYGGGQDGIFVCNQQVYVFAKREQQLAMILQLLTDLGGELTYRGEHIPFFYEQVLPLITPYLHFSENLTLTKDPDCELQAVLKLSFDDQKQLQTIIQYTYGQRHFDGGSGSVEAFLLREEIAEFGLEMQLQQAGFLTYPNSFQLHDEQAMYEFLSEQLPQISQTYVVEVSSELTEWSKITLPQATLGIRIEHDLLKVDVSQLQFSLADYQAIAAKYRLKKTYHRLENGAFVDLAAPGMQAVMDILDQLEVTDADVTTGEIIRNQYEALFLQESLQQTYVKMETNTAFQRLIADFHDVEMLTYQKPATITATLRPYQEVGVNWMQTLSHYRMGGILADDMGLGKTLQVITLLAAINAEQTQTLPHIVVTPKSLVYNWQVEFAKFSPETRVLLVSGSMSERREQIATIADYDVVITSYDAIRRDHHHYEAFAFHHVVLDEAHIVKNALTQGAKSVKTLASRCRLALTGTPIENSLADLWSLFDFVLPGYLGTYPEFKKNYERPITKLQNQERQQQLHQRTRPFILRRLKRDVLTELPEKLETTLYCQLEGEQRKLYEHTLLQANQQLQAEVAIKGEHQSRVLMWTLLLRLRQICCHPSLYLENYHEASAKLQLCLELVQESLEGNHQVLIFSQFTSMLDVIAQALEAQGIPYFLLTGKTSASQRVALAERFNNGEVPIFLISLKAGGTGLNLTGADVVIHYDPWWNLSAQNQATDRAHRMGQTNVVQVYQLLAKDTIEERIALLQQQKHGLAEALIQSGETFINQLSIEEMQQLLGGAVE